MKLNYVRKYIESDTQKKFSSSVFPINPKWISLLLYLLVTSFLEPAWQSLLPPSKYM